MELTPASNAISDNDEINNTFILLEEGKKKIKFSEEYRNVTLVLGNTGAGKSTFIQWIAGDNSKLISTEVVEGTGEFIIEDGNRIGSSINSKTIFPELVIDRKTDAAFYDSPGFSGTLSTSYDIAATYFTKKVSDHAENVKLILLAGYPAVRKGVDRQDFMKLMRHATDTIKNIRKFQNSIALVITKVDNLITKNGSYYSLVSDDNIIKTIANFLQDAKKELENKSKLPHTSNEEKTFCHNAILLINGLLKRNNDNYSRIGLFRRPDEPGPLSNINLLQESKKHIEEILYKEIKFTKTDHNDFGYTISEKTKNDINILVEKINEKVWIDISEITDKLKLYYRDLVGGIHSKVKSLINITDIVQVTQAEAQAFSTEINLGQLITSQILTESKNIANIADLANIMESSIAILGVHTCVDNVQNISEQGNFFNFLQLVSHKKLNVRPWSDLFQTLVDFLSNSKHDFDKDISRAAENIKDKINQHTKSLAKGMEEHYVNKIESLAVEQLLTELNQGAYLMSNLTQTNRNISNAQALSEAISQGISRSELAASSKIGRETLSIFYYEGYLGFLNILVSNSLEVKSVEWITQFNITKKSLYESEKWYKFLADLYATFSAYKTQTKISQYNKNKNDWGTLGKSQGMHITEANLSQFLAELTDHDIKGLDFIQNMEVTPSRLRAINDVLSLTLNQQLVLECSELRRLVIKGNFIKLSDVTNTDGKIVDLCGHGVSLSSVDIFALDTVFVDRDIYEIGSKLQLSIIAPKWQIIGSRKIILDGAPGISHAKAKGGYHPGEGGKDGLPGFPGGAAGNFFGISGKLIDGEFLSITADGGVGGAGQEGGDGSKGYDGESAERSDRFKNISIGHSQMLITVIYNSAGKSYIYFGKPGGTGGPGGKGGAGGFGGMKGEIKIFNLDEYSKLPFKQSIQGSKGTDGKGGVGGLGGMAGNDFEAIYCYKFVLFIPVHLEWCDEKSIAPSIGRAESGANGARGGSSAEMQPSEQSVEFQNIACTINNYKIYLRENLRDKFRKLELIQFVSQLDSHFDIKGSYDTLSLVDELQDLENQYHNQPKSVDLLPFYESLLIRTQEYAQNPRNSESSDQYKKSLSYLYTAILSRISTSKTTTEANLIIDLESYLTLVKQNINTLANLQENNNKVSIINQHKQAYKVYTEKRIGEAENLILTQVSPEIENINNQIWNKIDLLISEIIALKQQARAEEQQLIKKKRALEKALTASWILTGFKMFGQLLSCFNSLGAAVGSVIDSTGQVAESLSLEGTVSTLQLPDGVVSSIQSIHSKMVALKDHKFARFKNMLDSIHAEVNDHPEELSDTSTKVTELMVSFEAAQNNSDVNKMKELDHELKQELTRKASELNDKQKQRTDQKIAQAAAVITKLNQAIRFGTIGFDIYSKYSNDKRKAEIIDEAIKQSESKIQHLEEFEMNIHDTMRPMLRKAQNDLNNVASQLRNKSQIVLDVTHWQVQSFLKDIKLQMRQITRGFAVDDILARCIEKLEDIMTILIRTYGRIQDYEEQHRLAVYMADISSPAATQIHITNQNLSIAVRNLEITIRSILVVEQHKTAVNALTQQAFPFANRYLKETRLPSSFQSADNLQSLVDEAIKQVENMQSKLTAYKTAINNADAYISSGWFNRDYVSAQPFFVWANNKYQDAILKLLSGDKVMLKANIFNSPWEKDAIKFRNVGVNFVSKNSTVTTEITNKLKQFLISATHLGNSYYRYNNNIYIITSDSHNILFSFEKDASGEFVHKNNVYDKIKSGDLMLSPYATWEIQLVPSTRKINFQELTRYKDMIDLELVGYGSYITRGTNISQLDVESYYKFVETVSAIALSEHEQRELQISNTAHMSETLSTLTMAPPKYSTVHNRRRRHSDQRIYRQFPSVPSSAQRPTSWINQLWQGLWGCIAGTPPRLPQAYPTATVAYTNHHFQGSLQLLDLVIRKWTGQKYSPPSFFGNADIDYLHHTAANRLAYGAYCPPFTEMRPSLSAKIHELPNTNPQTLWLAYPHPTERYHSPRQPLT